MPGSDIWEKYHPFIAPPRASISNDRCVPASVTCRTCRDWLVYQMVEPGRHETERQIHLLTHPKKQGNGVYQGAFAFTLTKSPKDTKTVADMLSAVRKVMSQKTTPVVKYAWYYEDKGRDDNGDPLHPHIHGMYETQTGGMIPTRQWQRAWSLWDPDGKAMGQGFRGGYHRPVKFEEAYDEYIKKDGGMSESKIPQDE